ncbi:MAG: CoA transferase [Myxococcota bacterium]|jgi:crotonobetainyl-CoA:carnitine CoA-transferase CaiB-like acyl-CoA transferase|nr:CoA transferase [Myxococcota bacterium]
MTHSSSTDPSEADLLLPFAGLRVLDLSSEIAGPYATRLLVDAGAEVIKIESPGGDPLRRWTASHQDLAPDQDGPLFDFLNASKKSVVLDVETPEGREAFLSLARTADIVIESFAPGTMDRLGLSLATLQADNPGLSLVSISSFGQEGPWRDRPCTEFTLQAGVGSIDYRGLPGRKPMAAGGRLGEWAVGVFAAVGGLCAWLSSRKTGAGQLVDVSAFEVIALCMTIYHDLNGQFNEGDLARGIELPSIEPANDGWVGFCTITGQQWVDFCAMIGQQEVGEDHSYLEGYHRMQHIDFIQEIVHSWTKERTIDEIVELALLLRVPVAPIGDGKRLPEIDHFVERGVYSANEKGVLQPRPHYLLGEGSLRERGPAPRLGQHTDEVLAEAAKRELEFDEESAGTPLPLDGLRVLDLSAFWAGPMATCFLSDMGADVLKVESIQRPDGMRFAGARPGADLWEWSPVFHGANTGKRDVTLQFDHPEGLALVKQLIAKADVVIENFSARVLENFGLGWEAVHEINPRAIFVRMPAFGLDGPWRDRPGFAMTIEQVSGLAWMTGYHDLPLVIRGMCDPVGGMHAVFALLAALEVRKRTGRGQLVEVPLVEVALNLAAEQVLEHSAFGVLLSRDENRSPAAAPQGVYDCGEGRQIAISIATDEQWQALCRVMGAADLASDSALTTQAGRRAAHDRLDEAIEAWTLTGECEALVERLLDEGVPASMVVNGHRLMPNPQLEAREFFQQLTHPFTGDTRYPGFPMTWSIFGKRLHRSAPPTLGQDNDAVLREELGLSDDEIEALREKQVIGERPSFM